MQLERCDQISDESLEKYAMDSLPESMLAELEEHLLVCSLCREKLVEHDSYVDAIRVAATRLDREDESKRRLLARVSHTLTIPRLAWAMTVVALVLAAIGLRVSLRSSQPARPFAIMLGSMRSFDGQRAPAGRPIELSLDLAGVPSFPTYIVKVVNELGWLQLESIGVEGQGKVTTSLSGSLRRGDYIIQLYSPSREVLREYILKIE